MNSAELAPYLGIEFFKPLEAVALLQVGADWFAFGLRNCELKPSVRFTTGIV